MIWAAGSSAFGWQSHPRQSSGGILVQAGESSSGWHRCPGVAKLSVQKSRLVGSCPRLGSGVVLRVAESYGRPRSPGDSIDDG